MFSEKGIEFVEEEMIRFSNGEIIVSDSDSRIDDNIKDYEKGLRPFVDDNIDF